MSTPLQMYTHATGHDSTMVNISSPLELLTNKEDTWFKVADVAQVFKDALIIANWVAAIPDGTPLPLKAAKRLLARLEWE